MHVRHVRDALKTEFEGVIDTSDLSAGDADPTGPKFLSRALAAKAVRRLTGCTSQDAADCVIDGRDDYGIDAVAISDGAPELWLVQAKWSGQGRAGFDTEAANKLVRGFKQMDDQEFGRFNPRFQRMAYRVQSVLSDPRCRVILVVAVMGEGVISSEVQEILDDASRDFNVFGRTVETQILNGNDFLQAIRDDIAPPEIKIDATMSYGWHWRDTPFEAYYGLVSAEELAGWYEVNKDRLYAQNVRKSLGLTKVNQKLVDTLLREPHKFWYFNNGITVLCRTVTRHFFGRRDKGEPVRLELTGASVVNGAQTVTSVHRAFQENPVAAADAYVSVRIIVIEDGDSGFATEITKATNTQNHMERRDFIAIDATQSQIREDFQLSLNKEYVYKRGELDPPPDAGCSVVYAATALACAHPNPRFAIQAKRDVDLLWDQSPDGAYIRLFGQRPTAHQIWRSVLLLRAVTTALHGLRSELGGRAATIAEHGDLLIAHLVMQSIDQEGIDDPDSQWETSLVDVPALVRQALRLLIEQINKQFGSASYVSSTFANEQRSILLAEVVLNAMAAGAGGTDLADFAATASSRPTRRPSTVSLIVDSGKVPEGTLLIFRTASEAEREAVGAWLAEDARRSQATWTNNKQKPLLWQYDSQRYSPSGLTTHIWKLARWKDAWVSVQGPRQWSLPGGDSLVQLAEQIWQEVDPDEI
ncbi:putative abortive infection phage resistance protein [Dactylosporangium sucinum]|uniref:Abortive infection phage resistance protein n=2 Tax=Dactylosporangium sucinum TaxID=1424081 RepID=A0A917X128_9ACTN|nr:putative abortive infection phage resistance protein [Dactylosporangium sucinum]